MSYLVENSEDRFSDDHVQICCFQIIVERHHEDKI